MRVLIVSQVFAPSHDAISQLLQHLTSDLAADGIDVHVLTSGINYMTGEALPRRERLAGATVWRIPGPAVSKFTWWGKLSLYATFLGLSWPWLLLLPRPDVVVYLSTPPLLGASAGLLRRLRGAKTCYIAQDIYPEVPIRMGRVTNPLLTALLTRLDRVIGRGFDAVVVVGERMAETMHGKGFAPQRVHVIENWCVNDEVAPIPRADNPMLQELGLVDRFVVQYSGNIGVAHDIAPLLDAAAQLEAQDDITFLFIGDGTRRAEIEAAKRDQGLDNIVLLPYQDAARLPQSLAAADLAVVSLLPALEGLVVPSKLYGILAAGVPVLNIGDPDGEVARVVARGRCGVTVTSGTALAQAVLELKRDPARRAALGRRARELFDRAYGRDPSVGKYRALLADLARS